MLPMNELEEEMQQVCNKWTRRQNKSAREREVLLLYNGDRDNGKRRFQELLGGGIPEG